MARKKAATGYFDVELNFAWEHLAFVYKPGLKHRVDDTLLAEMQKQGGLVANVVAAD